MKISMVFPISSLSIGREGGGETDGSASELSPSKSTLHPPLPQRGTVYEFTKIKKHFPYICTPIFVFYACLFFSFAKRFPIFRFLKSLRMSVLSNLSVILLSTSFSAPFSPFHCPRPSSFFLHNIRSQQHLGSEREVGITENQTHSPFFKKTTPDSIQHMT